MSETLKPRQYDVVELVRDVISRGRVIPAGERGTIVEIQGPPGKAYTVEFDHNRFGDAFLPDLKVSDFKIVT